MKHKAENDEEESASVAGDDTEKDFGMERREQLPELNADTFKGGVAEEDAAERPEMNGKDDGKDTFDALAVVVGRMAENVLSPHTMDDTCQSVNGSPHDKVEGSSVPQAADNHRDKEIGITAPPSLAIAPQRNVNIILDPRRQGNVPTPP